MKKARVGYFKVAELYSLNVCDIIGKQLHIE